MLLHHFGHDVFVRFPLALAVFRAQGQPPELHQNSLLVEVIRHLLDGVAGKSVGARVPVAVSVKPAIIQRRPLDAKFLQLRDRAQHLRRSDVEFVTPSAPAHVVGFARRLGDFPSFFLQHARPQVQGFVKIAGVHGYKTARRGIGFSGLEGGVRSNVHAGVDGAIGFHFDRQRQGQRKRFHMTDRFSYLRSPERDHRDAAAIAAFHVRAHQVGLGEFASELDDVVFAPVITRPVEAPHVVRLRLLFREAGVEFVLLLNGAVDVKILRARVFVFRAREQQVGEIVVDLDFKRPLDAGSLGIQPLSREFPRACPGPACRNCPEPWPR